MCAARECTPNLWGMVYLDHAATTPMRQSAIDAWVEHAGALNAGSQHAAGRKANAVLADARERIATALGADPVEVVFTGSGTEANNIGVRGLHDASGGGRVVSTPIEHPAVLEVVKSLGQTAWLPVGRDGVVSDLSALDASAAATAAALEEAVAEMGQEQQRIAGLRDAVVAGVKAAVPEVIVAKHEPCLPGHAHFMFPGANADALIMLLDAQGIQVSAGSACASGVLRMSHVLEAMGYSEREAMGALRVTVGRTNTHEDVDQFLAAIPEVVERARVAGAL